MRKIELFFQTRTAHKSADKYKHYLIKRIILTNLFTLIVVVITYLWMIFFLSNLSSFWEIFRPKDISSKSNSLPPAPPYLSPIAQATNEETFDIAGITEPGIKVHLYINQTKDKSVVSGMDGAFVFTGIKAGVFPQKIYVTAENETQNESKPSTRYSIFYDSEPPEVELVSPKDGETFSSTGHTYRVAGKTEPRSTVLINEQLAIVTPDGDFSANLRLEEGNNIIEIKVLDQAKNETIINTSVSFNKID